MANSQRQDVSLAMIQLATERLISLTRMEELIDGPVEGRLASTLLRLGEAMGSLMAEAYLFSPPHEGQR